MSALPVKLSAHDLRQLDEDVLRHLPEEALRALSASLLADLKEARERLSRTPANSSRPPSSRPAWERGRAGEAAADEEREAQSEAGSADGNAPPGGSDEPPPPEGATQAPAQRRKPGKQPGAPGAGRTERFVAQATEEHRPAQCALCAGALAPGTGVPYTAFQSLDVQWGDPAAPGLHLRVTDHVYLEASCPCGHRTRAHPAQGEVDPTLAPVTLGEWRVVGPGLATLIVALSLRFRLSRARIRELLADWLGVRLSTGTIHAALNEAAAAIAPAEPELVAEIQGSGLLHADETSWPQGDRTLWLWVFASAATTLYVVAGRGKETVSRMLAGFAGWLMSDGWFSYRGYPHRLRCWAHLLRKAQGLAECCDPQGCAFGHRVRTTLEALMAAVYAARDGPTRDLDLMPMQAARLDALRRTAVAHLGHRHEKTRALAVELLNDWEAIFQVLRHPELPLTNNVAERALRHWVIARGISHGTRNAVGSRAFALLASVVDTCRQRGHSPWLYLVAGIAERRAGRSLPPLPAVGV